MELIKITDLKQILKESLRNPNRKTFHFSSGRANGKTKIFKEILEELAKERTTLCE